ncbi:MAG: toprim domain-containing protein [Parasporobacterium sp.]|nr:toprim domain-containing protein [Parasporobacterium sp.]
MRGTYANFKGEVPGSDKRFSFSLGNLESKNIHVFESAIDLLSYLTLDEMCGKSWKHEAYLSLGGVATNAFIKNLRDRYMMYIEQPTYGKDVNDTLMHIKVHNRRKEGRSR